MQRYTITQAINDVANQLSRTGDSGDHSPTTIRCCLNDALDFASKEGMATNFGYDQPRAVRKVRRLLGYAN